MTSGVDVAFRNILYGYYSEDLSGKVRSARRVRAEKGEYVSAYAPFGFMKDKNDKHRLVVDREAAGIVSRIFHMAAGGMSTTQIARLLNDEAVPTPYKYKRKQGFQHKWPVINEDNFWTGRAILKILRDAPDITGLNYIEGENK